MSSPLADFELTVAGYVRLFGGQLDDEARSVLREGLGDSADGDWAAVFAYARYPDGTVEKVTIFTAEVGYAQRIAGAAGGRIPLPVATVQQRFPRVRPGWVIDNGAAPPVPALTQDGPVRDQDGPGPAVADGAAQGARPTRARASRKAGGAAATLDGGGTAASRGRAWRQRHRWRGSR
jgi:hypothetical protein